MEANTACANLLAPGRIGALTLRNRMVMPPMGTNFASSDGYITQRSIDYYAARAAGGVGMVIVEIAGVELPRGKGLSHQIGIDDEKFVPGLSDLAAAIKGHGARAFIQLHHAGREAHLSGTDIQPIAPSAIRSINPKMAEPHAMSVDEIEEMIERFVAGAERAKRAGFDGVEIHGAHSYLLSQFLSPLCNTRSDDYGGSVANRARMVVEVVQGVKRRLGREYPVAVRLTGDEYLKGGITIDETCAVARMLEEAGADAIDVSAGGHTSPKPISVAPARYPNGHLLHLPARVKQDVRVPVIGVGRINTPALAEAALRDGKCDLIALGRALIVDPEFPNKVAAGRGDEIRPCTACLHCAHTVVLEDVTMVCGNNPAAGRERELVLQPAAAPKKVFVVGGGVAGMEAARVAALRGHDVTLYERGDQLGGQLISAAIPPDKGELSLLRAYYVGQIARAGVKTRLGDSAAASAIAAARPDAVVVATGSQPRIPDIPGGDGPHVVLAEDVLLGKAAAGRRVVVIGGEMVGCETAEYLAAQGKQVTIARRGQRLASTIAPMLRRPQLDRLAELKVATLTGVQYEEINERGVVVTAADGNRQLLEADTIVLAAGSTPLRDLATALEGQVAVVEVIGDAVQPRRFLEAIQEGMAAGMAI